MVQVKDQLIKKIKEKINRIFKQENNYQMSILKFRHPQTTQNFTKIKSSQQLGRRLIRQKPSDINVADPQYQISTVGNQIVAKCKLCKAKLTYLYQKQQDIYSLYKAVIQHQHLGRFIKGIQSIQSKATKKFNEKQLYDKGLKAVQNKISKLQITDQETKKQLYLKHQIQFGKEVDQAKIIKGILRSNKIDFIDYHGSIEKDPTASKLIPEILIFTNKFLLGDYINQGRVLSFDYAKKAYVKANPKKGVRQFYIGILSGLSSLGEPTIYACVLFQLPVNRQKQIFSKIFQRFFQFSSKRPDTIIVNWEKNVTKALKSIKKSKDFQVKQQVKQLTKQNDFQVIIDSKSALSYIEEDLTNKENIKYFKKLLSKKNKNQFNYFFKQVQKTIGEQLQSNAITSFKSGMSKFCFALQQPKFNGYFSFVQSFNEVFIQFIESQIGKNTLQKEMYSYKLIIPILISDIEKFNRHIKKSGNPQNIKLQKIYGIDSLQNIRMKLGKRTYNCFVKQLAKTFKLQVQKTGQHEEYIVKNSYSSYCVAIGMQKWECQCGFYAKSGLPCQHELKMCIDQETPIQKQIHQKWTAKIDYRTVPGHYKPNLRRLGEGKKGRPAKRVEPQQIQISQ